MSESTAGQLTLRDINAKLQGAGLDILRPEQIKSIGAYTTRERFVQALEVVPANTSAVQFLRNIITRVTAPNQESAADESASVREVQDETAKPIQVRIPRHPATQSALIWPGIPGPSGHLFHGHPAGQSERSDAGVALLVRVGWRRQFLRPFAH